MQKSIVNRTIFCRDNIEVLPGMDSDSVDLIYLDPPFNKKKTFAAPIGSKAEGASFKDYWAEEDTKDEWIGLIADEHPVLHDFLEGITRVGDKSNKYYLVYMAVRLLELKRILKPTGSVYLHCDPTMSHYLKLLMDCTLGANHFQNEIIWHYDYGARGKGRYGKKHDVIFWYSKTEDYIFNRDSILVPFASKMTEWRYTKGGQAGKEMPKGKVPSDVWDIKLNAMSSERLGYPTQKPVELLKRIINGSTSEKDMVLDPFCGCATTCVAAEQLGRQWIGIDVSPRAFDLVKPRLNKEVADGEDLLKRANAITYREDIPVRTDLVTSPIKKNQVRQFLYGKQKGLCTGCDTLFPFQNLTIDHILPKNKGGQDNPENMQLLCGFCNSIKGDRDMPFLRSRLVEMKILK